ncbi:hypothetical protein QBC38DRAFT_444574 [Podospora fimiseda]|uniref:Uncharacterized protein n=1 Tax=Podospora fimiseda TaxID=252190 RepID=A0AAN7BNC7_9PEZI|nr:hypothetical protein QBC38DRAFT_444574 [Podospora fimiseda]
MTKEILKYDRGILEWIYRHYLQTYIVQKLIHEKGHDCTAYIVQAVFTRARATRPRTFTAATVMIVINTELNSTTTTTIKNKSPSNIAPITDSSETKVGKTGWYTVYYPTPLIIFRRSNRFVAEGTTKKALANGRSSYETFSKTKTTAPETTGNSLIIDKDPFGWRTMVKDAKHMWTHMRPVIWNLPGKIHRIPSPPVITVPSRTTFSTFRTSVQPNEGALSPTPDLHEPQEEETNIASAVIPTTTRRPLSTPPQTDPSQSEIPPKEEGPFSIPSQTGSSDSEIVPASSTVESVEKQGSGASTTSLRRYTFTKTPGENDAGARCEMKAGVVYFQGIIV